MRLARLLVFAVILVLAAIMVPSASAVSVSEDYNKGTDFSKYKSFALKVGTPAPSPLGQDRIEKAITAQLEGKGMKASADAPDLQVFTHVQISSEKVVDVNSFGYGGYHGWGGWGGGFATSTVNVREIPVGTLVVDLVDSSSKELVWRGVASDTINPNAKPEKREKVINQAVAKLFKKFPPIPAKK